MQPSDRALMKAESEERCDVCGKPIVFVRYMEDGRRLMAHKNKKDDKRCARIWVAKKKAESAERMFANIDLAKAERLAR